MTSACPTPEPALVVTRYETLRRVALGEALPPEARTGLTLFLRRGMWGWAQANVTESVVSVPASGQRRPWQPPEANRPLIHLLAALAINVDYEGDRP
ncbi:MAG: hypothetical protein AB7G75_34265 [Candidatus Binatia bacterium]